MTPGLSWVWSQMFRGVLHGRDQCPVDCQEENRFDRLLPPTLTVRGALLFDLFALADVRSLPFPTCSSLFKTPKSRRLPTDSRDSRRRWLQGTSTARRNFKDDPELEARLIAVAEHLRKAFTFNGTLDRPGFSLQLLDWSWIHRQMPFAQGGS